MYKPFIFSAAISLFFIITPSQVNAQIFDKLKNSVKKLEQEVQKEVNKVGDIVDGGDKNKTQNAAHQKQEVEKNETGVPPVKEVVSKRKTRDSVYSEIKKEVNSDFQYISYDIGTETPYKMSFSTTIRDNENYSYSFRIPSGRLPPREWENGFYVRLNNEEFVMGKGIRCRSGVCFNGFGGSTAVNNEDGRMTVLFGYLNDTFVKGGFIEFKYAKRSNDWLKVDIPPNSGKADSVAEVINVKPELAVAAPVTVSVYESDPIYNQCNSDRTLSEFYDCTCLAQNSEQYKAQTVIGPDPQATKAKLLEQNALDEVTLEKIANGTIGDGYKQKFIDRIERNNKMISYIDNPNLITEVNTNDLFKTMAGAGICKNTQGVFEREKNSCLAVGRGNPTEEYCTCVGNAASKLWSDYPGIIGGSDFQVSLSVTARQACD